MKLLKEIRACSLCEDVLPFAPKPILQFSKKSSLLIVGQAPGLAAHNTEKPWNDKSGIRLRHWICIKDEDFYNPSKTAIVPMGFCYPGRGTGGDNPPRPECSVRWMDIILNHLSKVKVKIIIGSYAASYFCHDKNLQNNIKHHAYNDSDMIVLPHPSPRNNIWLKKNPWFEIECLPAIRTKLAAKSHQPEDQI